MRSLRTVAVLVVALAGWTCGSPSPTPTSPSTPDGAILAPLPQPAASNCTTIGFDELQGNGAAFRTLSSCGFTVTATTPNWTVSTGYGKPAPFIQFAAAAGASVTADVTVIATGGGKFTFQSVDVYSSTTKIPYEITGLAGLTTVFSLHNTQGNTFGNFATVSNPQPSAPIDTLVIHLTNPAAPCCPNPVGIDNIKVQR